MRRAPSFYIPFSGLQSMTELFRRRVIKLLLQREPLNDDFAHNLLSWKHSGFSIDTSVRILDQSSQESLAELTPDARPSSNPPGSRPGQHIPPRRLQLVRRYGPYASRTKG